MDCKTFNLGLPAVQVSINTMTSSWSNFCCSSFWFYRFKSFLSIDSIMLGLSRFLVRSLQGLRIFTFCPELPKQCIRDFTIMVYSIVGPFLKTRDDEDDNDSDDSDDDIDNIFIKFVNHPCIEAIRPNFNITSKFSFQVVSVNDVK